MQQQHQDPLIQEALRWLGVLKDKDATDADRQGFDNWLKSDARHQDAWRRASQVWMRVGKIGPAFRARESAALEARKPSLDISAQRSTVLSGRPTKKAKASPSRRRFLHSAIAVTAVAATVAPAGILLIPGLFAGHRTAIGQRETVTLPEGSTVELAGASSLSVDFSAHARRVVLHGGEAFFTVRPDGGRPFIVEAASGQVLAPEAMFDIKHQGDSVTVAVIDGAVAVSLEGAGRVAVDKGRQVRFDGRTLGAVQDADIARVEAWRRDQLVFEAAPLGDVIADLERYRPGLIVVTDNNLRDIPVTAIVDTHQADAGFDRIVGALPVRVRRISDLLAVLSPLA